MPLKDVLEEIKNSAFKISHYPVILHIFVFCGEHQLKEATELIRNILEEKNIAKFSSNITEEDLKELDSPEALRLKYIIMCERPRFTPKKIEIPDEELNVEDDTESLTSAMIDPDQYSLLPPTMKRTLIPDMRLTPKKRQESPFNHQSNTAKNKPTYDRFINMIYLICGKKINYKKFRYPWEVTETTYSNLMDHLKVKNNKKDLEIHNKHHLTYIKQPLKLKEVIYMDQLQKDCFEDPAELWNLGIQMVGIFQSVRSKQKVLNTEFFRQRGGKKFGYVLRKEIADYMATDEEKKTGTLHIISIKILSVNQIPQVEEFKAETVNLI